MLCKSPFYFICLIPTWISFMAWGQVEVDSASQLSDTQQLSLRFGPSGPNKHRMWSQQVTVWTRWSCKCRACCAGSQTGFRCSVRRCERLPARGQTLTRVMEWSLWTRRARGAEGQGLRPSVVERRWSVNPYGGKRCCESKEAGIWQTALPSFSAYAPKCCW